MTGHPEFTVDVPAGDLHVMGVYSPYAPRHDDLTEDAYGVIFPKALLPRVLELEPGNGLDVDAIRSWVKEVPGKGPAKKFTSAKSVYAPEVGPCRAGWQSLDRLVTALRRLHTRNRPSDEVFRNRPVRLTLAPVQYTVATHGRSGWVLTLRKLEVAI